MRTMKIIIIALCLTGAVFAMPIAYEASQETNEVDSNSTESASVSQSSENNTSELQNSEESTSSQSSESKSESESESVETVESTSEDTTSEESDSQSDESTGIDSMGDTRDNSLSSEENVRQNWLQNYNLLHDLSDEDNSSSAEDAGQSQRPTQAPGLNQPLVDSANTSSSSESSESSESRQSSESSEASDSGETQPLETNDCVNGTQSCESEEYFFQDIGDDGQHGVDNLMVPDDDGERELSLRR